MSSQAVGSVSDMLSATGLVKRFGRQRVLASVSLSCSRGEVVVLLGANGAGKSTLLRTLAGLIRPDSGVVSKPKSWRVGLAAHHTFLYNKLSVFENINLYSRLVGALAHERDELIERWGLKDFLNTPVVELSKGTSSKVALCRALLGRPELLLLDEPSSNLDERSVEVLRETIDSQKERGVAVVATHDLSRLLDVATRVVVLERGECIADSGANASADVRNQVVQRYREANR
jgi:ABC-type multidrug transport system ATPase subunit